MPGAIEDLSRARILISNDDGVDAPNTRRIADQLNLRALASEATN